MAKYDAVAIGDILEAVSHGVSRIELEVKTKIFFISSVRPSVCPVLFSNDEYGRFSGQKVIE